MPKNRLLKIVLLCLIQANIILNQASTSTNNCKDGDTLVAHSDCKKYIRCEFDYNNNVYNEYVQDCWIGSRFIPETKQCQWSENLDCSTDPFTTTTKPTTTTVSTLSTTATVSVTCSSGELYVQHPDCTKYFRCERDYNTNEIKEYVETCWPGSKFNPITKQCQWVPNTDCSIDSFTSTTTTTTTTTPTKPLTSTTTTTAKPTTTTISIACSTGELYVPHPDCTKYIRCERDPNTNEVKEYVETCWANSKFNPVTKQCQWVPNTDCSIDSFTATTTSITTTTPTKPSTSTPATTTTISIACSTGELYVQHPDCTKYIRCERDYSTNEIKEYVETCWAGSKFNPTTKQCQWVPNTDCSIDSFTSTTTTITTTTPTKPSTTTTVITTSVKSITTTISTACASGEMYVPHADCTKYIRCERDYTTNQIKEYVETCWTGSKFNSITKQCQWVSNVDCSIDSFTTTTTKTTTTTTTTEKPTTTTTAIVLTTTTTISAACLTGEMYVPHPDCTKYIRCERDYSTNEMKQYVENCWPGSKFNNYTKQCQWVPNTDCSVDHFTTTTTTTTTSTTTTSTTTTSTTTTTTTTTTIPTKPTTTITTTSFGPTTTTRLYYNLQTSTSDEPFYNKSTTCAVQNSKKRMMCYFSSWSVYRPSPANMRPEDLDPCLCTHVLYSFVPFSNSQLQPGWNDIELFQKMAAWKQINPDIKIQMSIGGWGATGFEQLFESEATRTKFCQSVIDTCRKYNLDGIDIDWEYPSDAYRDQYTSTAKICFDLFTAEAASSGKPKLLLSAATAPDSRMSALDLPALNQLLDYINPMTYDFHGSWDGNNQHHSALYGWIGAESTLKRYIAAGMSPEKLNLGLAAYGRATGEVGPYTRESGMLAYYEICPLLCNDWVDTFDNSTGVPKAQKTSGTAHVFYDNPESMIEKAKYVLNSNIGGAFIWDTALDDFSGQFCCQGKFPLIKSVVNVFTGKDPSIDNECCKLTA